MAAGTITRAWIWTYRSLGRMETATDPDSHPPTSYTYYADNRHRLDHNQRRQTHQEITAYDAHGRPLSMTDPNPLVSRSPTTRAAA